MPEFAEPFRLLLLPLALLPLWPRARDAIHLPSLAWIPSDRVGGSLMWCWRTLAALTLACLIVALAAPGKPEARIERIGRGAELMILLDRSASMDTNIRRSAPKPGEKARDTQTKNDVVREALTWFLAQRPNNRYSLTLFNVVAMPVAPFTDDSALVQAAVDASGIGRGPKETNMGRALQVAIEAFADRPYTGSRSILLVSDGGARLDAETREAIRLGLERHRINLYFIYIQGGFTRPDFDVVGVDPASLSEEVALHVFFKSLGTDYRVFQADDLDSLAAAIALIDEQQNQPLTYWLRVPRIDDSKAWYLAALLGCLMLAAMTALKRSALR